MCPYEVILPEEMNHNQFDYDSDLIFPLKDFLKRHTGFKSGDTCDIDIPSFYFEIPLPVKEMLNNLKIKNTQEGVSSCLCGENIETTVLDK